MNTWKLGGDGSWDYLKVDEAAHLLYIYIARLNPDSKRGLVLSSNGESGNLTILHQDSPDQYTTLQTLKTLPGARTLALNPTTGEIYTVSATLAHRPASTKEIPNPKPPIVPNSFVVLVIGRRLPTSEPLSFLDMVLAANMKPAPHADWSDGGAFSSKGNEWWMFQMHE